MSVCTQRKHWRRNNDDVILFDAHLDRCCFWVCNFWHSESGGCFPDQSHCPLVHLLENEGAGRKRKDKKSAPGICYRHVRTKSSFLITAASTESANPWPSEVRRFFLDP